MSARVRLTIFSEFLAKIFFSWYFKISVNFPPASFLRFFQKFYFFILIFSLIGRIQKYQLSICLVIWQSFLEESFWSMRGVKSSIEILRIVSPSTNQRAVRNKTRSTYSAGYFSPFGWGVNSRKQIQKGVLFVIHNPLWGFKIYFCLI